MGERQRLWQRQQVAAGNCGQCGKPRQRFRWRCDACQEKNRQMHRRRRRERIAAGNCAICGEPRQHYARLCDSCEAAFVAYKRAKKGYKPWRPGGVGRPPKVRPETKEAA